MYSTQRVHNPHIHMQATYTVSKNLIINFCGRLTCTSTTEIVAMPSMHCFNYLPSLLLNCFITPSVL